MSNYNLTLSDDKNIWIIFCFIAVVFFICQHDLLHSTNMVEKGLSTTEEIVSSTEQGSLKRQAALLSLGVFAFFSLMRRTRHPLKINGLLGWVIIFYVVWSGLSIFWADDFSLTFKRVFTLAIFSLAALAVAERLTWHQIFLLIIFCGLLYMGIGFCAEIALGTFRPFNSEYCFSGTMDANVGSWGLGIMIIAAVFLTVDSQRGRTFFLTIILVSLIALILNKTRTTFGAVIIALIIYGGLNSSNLIKMVSATLLTMVLYISYFLLDERLLVNAWKIFMLGKEDSTLTLTGRIPVWKECFSFIQARPFFGYGYNAFWTAKHVRQISDKADWGIAGVPWALNGYIDLALGVGLVGLAAYMLLLILALKEAIVSYSRTGNSLYLSIFAMLIFYVVVSFLESLPYNAGYATFIFFTILAKLAFGDKENDYGELDYESS